MNKAEHAEVIYIGMKGGEEKMENMAYRVEKIKSLAENSKVYENEIQSCK